MSRINHIMTGLAIGTVCGNLIYQIFANRPWIVMGERIYFELGTILIAWLAIKFMPTPPQEDGKP